LDIISNKIVDKDFISLNLELEFARKDGANIAILYGLKKN